MKGRIFEEIVLKVFQGNFKDFSYHEWGRFWDKTCEIDIVGLNRPAKTAILIECKTNSREINEKFIQEFKNKEGHLSTVLQGFKFRKCIAVANSFSDKKTFAGIEIFDCKTISKLLD